MGTKFILHVTRNHGSTLDLPFAPVNGQIALFIASSPEIETGPIHAAHPMGFDPHFRIYYEFIDGFDPAKEPFPFTSTSPTCPPGTMTSNPALEICGKCPADPTCNNEQITWAIGPLPSGLNCVNTQWP